MIEDDLDTEDVDVDQGDGLPEDLNVGPDSDEPEDLNEQDELPVAKTVSKPTTEIEELPSVEAKRKERDALEKAMEEFLARGGKIQNVETKE